MKQLFTRPSLQLRFSLMLALVLGTAGLTISVVQAQVIAPTQTDEIIIDNGAAGQADPGDRIRYKVTIQNTGAAAGTNTQLNAVPDPRTTFVPNSFKSSPLAVPDAYTCTGNVGIDVPVASGVKANDFDDNLSGATLAVTTPPTNGTVMLNNDGSFTYMPNGGFTGTDVFTYTMTDVTPVPTAPVTDATTVTITVSNLIWFVDNTGGGSGGTGTLSTPFKTLADFNAGSTAAASVVYIEETGTNYTGGIVLQDGERLFGEGHTGAANLSGVLPFALAPNSKTLPNINGTRPVITNASGDGVTLAMNNTLRGFDVGACSLFAINNTGTNSVGNLTISEVNVNNTTGGGLDVSHGGALTVTFPSFSTNGGTYGIDLTTCTGTVTVSGGTITNPVTAGVYIKDGTVTFSSSGAITTNAGFAVDIDNHDSNNITFSGNITSTGMGIRVQNCGGGLITFSGTSKSLTTGANTAVNLTDNASGAIDFTGGGLVINTTTGVGFTATSGGTVNVTGTNNITKSGNGAALNINMVNAGASGISFAFVNVTGGTGTAITILTSSGIKNLGDVDVARSGGGSAIVASSAGTINITDGTINSGNQIAIDIDNTVLGVVLTTVSANGASYGIDVTNTMGSFTINGTSTTDGSGGTIQNIINRGVNFNNATNVTLKNMTFTNANTADGGGTCDASGVLGCNAALFMSTVSPLVLNNIDVNGTAQEGLNGDNITTMTLTGSSFTNCGSNEQFEGCVRIRNLQGTCSISSSTFTFPSDRAVEIVNTSSATPLTLTVTGCTFADNFGKANGEQGLFVMTAAGTNSVVVSNSCNFTRIKADGVFIGATGGTLNANVIDCTFSRGIEKYMNGVYMSPDGNSVMNINVNRNTMTVTGGYGVLVQGNGTATFNARVNNNTITGGSGCSDCVTGGGETVTCNCFGDGIVVRALASSTGNAEANSNIITGIDDTGRGIGGEAQSDGTLNFQISSNMITIAGDAFDAIDLAATAPGGLSPVICGKVNNNTTVISGTGPQTFTCHFRARASGAMTNVNLQTPGANAAGVWDMNANTPTSATATSNGNPVVFSSASGGGTITVGTCPALPPGHPTAMLDPEAVDARWSDLVQPHPTSLENRTAEWTFSNFKSNSE